MVFPLVQIMIGAVMKAVAYRFKRSAEIRVYSSGALTDVVFRIVRATSGSKCIQLDFSLRQYSWGLFPVLGGAR
jgi:hypothetical protein